MIPAEAQQSARADHLLRDVVPSAQESLERNGLAGANALQHAEISGGQNAEVVAILAVDALEALSDDQAHAGGLLRKRARFARRALAVALASDDYLEAAVLESIGSDGRFAARLEADVGIAAEAGIVEKTHRDRCDLVGRNVIAQGPAILEGQIAAAELLPYGFG